MRHWFEHLSASHRTRWLSGPSGTSIRDGDHRSIPGPCPTRGLPIEANSP
ncbi:hypothetical protein Salmuc_01508 [Salipiger mucosus DSM 16094]|uniref:Uncharacterized protein n=1 Tax=Salipiger mucosus DSM 16094 TaxID=1123237 RepID=S9R4K2_9RHOB|nr:hypothetical protein Salmuc_01508 [Salipiger mucosus DSM 16094]